MIHAMNHFTVIAEDQDKTLAFYVELDFDGSEHL